MERVADYIIRKVNEAGAECIFLLTGRGILYLTDAVAKNKNIRHISTYHEQGASYASMAYSAARNSVAVCLVSTGCAATNAVTACLCAYQDNLPVVFISGNNPLAENQRHTGVNIRTYGSQEADIISVVQNITKYAVMLECKEEVAITVENALYLAQEGRKGPVWIDVPLDVQNMHIDEKELLHFTVPDGEPDVASLDEQAQVVAEELGASKRPILLVGGGARDAAKEIKKLVEEHKIPLAFSPSACDIYGTSHELSIGAVGSLGGSRAGNFVVQNADYILAVGTKLCSQETGMKHAFARTAKIIVLDIDENEHTKDGIHIDRIINADAKIFLSKLCEQNIKTVASEWEDRCRHWKEVFAVSKEAFIGTLRENNELDLYMFAQILSEALADDAAVITDAGFEELIIPSTIKYKDGQRCLFPASQGAMGYAIPAIIGVYEAGRKNIVCVVGDGSFMMNMQELQTIKALDISAKIFVISNNMYAVIRKRQTDLFRKRTIGNDPSDGVPKPDFKKIADSFGVDYLCVDSKQTLEDCIADILASDGLQIIEVACTPDQTYLHESYALNDRKKLVHRPIEDMAPFLKRDVIRGEMVIPMMEE